MSESLVVIRTYGDLMAADDAQVELLSAGIYSLVYTDENTPLHPQLPVGQAVVLAVHRRDADIAEAVLTASADAV